MTTITTLDDNKLIITTPNGITELTVTQSSHNDEERRALLEDITVHEAALVSALDLATDAVKIVKMSFKDNDKFNSAPKQMLESVAAEKFIRSYGNDETN